MSGKRARHSKNNPRKETQLEKRTEAGLENAGFIVELFLDGSRQVRLTQTLHVKSTEGESWEGWDVDRLAAFIIKHSGLLTPDSAVTTSGESTTSVDSETESLKMLNTFLTNLRSDLEALNSQGKQYDLRVNKTHGFRAHLYCEGELIPVEIPRLLLSNLGAETIEILLETALTMSAPKKFKPRSQSQERQRVEAATIEQSAIQKKTVEQSAIQQNPNQQLQNPQHPLQQKIDVIPALSHSPSRVLKSGEPFRLRLPINLTEMELRKSPVNYRVDIAARMWDDRTRRSLGQRTGVVNEADVEVSFDISQELPPGVYRFEADLEFNPDQSKKAGRLGMTSGFIQIV